MQKVAYKAPNRCKYPLIHKMYDIASFVDAIVQYALFPRERAAHRKKESKFSFVPLSKPAASARRIGPEATWP